MINELKKILHQRLAIADGSSHSLEIYAIGGGSINATYRLEISGRRFFCKGNSATKFPHLFSKEKSGLQRLDSENVIETPAVIDCFEEEGYQFLLLQWIAEGERTSGFWKTFGEQLAALHRVSSEQFGLTEDNYMGSVAQSNQQHHRWIDFFVQERLRPMITRCEAKGLLNNKHQRLFEQLQEKLADFFEEEPPSLLHGDLWSGNFMCDGDEKPVLIDPAVYFGHRSMDLGMTTLFGGFQRPFYEAYHHHFPLPTNHQEQWAVCNLYPLLIHLYLFSTSYLPQIERTLRRFT
jgi:fructosamine-3-kinase